MEIGRQGWGIVDLDGRMSVHNLVKITHFQAEKKMKRK
jgi:hypothetical protein